MQSWAGASVSAAAYGVLGTGIRGAVSCLSLGPADGHQEIIKSSFGRLPVLGSGFTENSPGWVGAT